MFLRVDKYINTDNESLFMLIALKMQTSLGRVNLGGTIDNNLNLILV